MVSSGVHGEPQPVLKTGSAVKTAEGQGPPVFAYADRANQAPLS